MNDKIPFNRPAVAGRELEYVADAVARGRISGDGWYTEQCCDWLQDRYGVARVLLTPSCTDALEMAAMLLELQPGDEVIMPSFTFVSTANAAVREGARPVFVDVRPDTGNIDEKKIEAAITDRTKAIFVVHYAGVGCEMATILELADRHGIEVIEDAAQGVEAAYQDRALGSLGALGTYSFHETKNYTCGEGGALCVNAHKWIERAEIIRDKGTNRQAFFRGEIDKYTWTDVGSSFVLGELASAFLLAQLEAAERLHQQRAEIYHRYLQWLQPLSGELQLPVIPAACRSNHHLFSVRTSDGETRDALMNHLRQRQIHAVFHYVPLHLAPMGQQLGYQPGDFPVTEQFSATQLRLPLYQQLTPLQQRRIVAEIYLFFGKEPEQYMPSDLGK